MRADVRQTGLNDPQTDVTCDIDGVKQTRHIALIGDKPQTVEFTQKLTAQARRRFRWISAKFPTRRRTRTTMFSAG